MSFRIKNDVVFLWHFCLSFSYHIFVDYDLKNKRDYQTLCDELSKFDVKVLKSCWCLKVDNLSSKNISANSSMIMINLWFLKSQLRHLGILTGLPNNYS